MNEIQRGTTPVIPVRLRNLDEGKEIASVEFVFKARNSAKAPEVVRKAYPDRGVGLEDGVFYILLTEEETRDMTAFAKIYMGTRVCYADGTIPHCKTVPFTVDETLFEEKSGV